MDRAIGEFDLDPEPILAALRDCRPTDSEVQRRGTVVLRRTVPLSVGRRLTGALVLLRDVSELRRRDRLLDLKDATIREVHHRVKNNLQTVASLLRLQARRLDRPEVRQALEESERRIRAIALVHETLSVERGDTVDFDQVAGEVVAMVREGLAAPGLDLAVEGSMGEVSAAVATPLAVVLSELLQNSVEHAEPGRIGVLLRREDGSLRLEVRDDGRGLPKGFSLDDGAGLGLSIVRGLVESELGGEMALDDAGGTTAVVRVPLEGAG
jgi:two-component system, sensor histidine kinase PdtaS